MKVCLIFLIISFLINPVLVNQSFGQTAQTELIETEDHSQTLKNSTAEDSSGLETKNHDLSVNMPKWLFFLIALAIALIIHCLLLFSGRKSNYSNW